jgi:hypothetical protein
MVNKVNVFLKLYYSSNAAGTGAFAFFTTSIAKVDKERDWCDKLALI